MKSLMGSNSQSGVKGRHCQAEIWRDRKPTHEHPANPADIPKALVAGALRRQTEMRGRCFSFTVIDRLAASFGFFAPVLEAFEAGAK